MSDIILGGTVSPGGPFEIARSDSVKGAPQSVSDAAARLAIADYLRVEGMYCWQVDVATMYQLRGGITNADWKLANLTLVGDLSGTTSSSIVVKVNGTTVPAGGSLSVGNTLQVAGASSLAYGSLDLAGGANYVFGLLPASNQAAQTLTGSLTGTTSTAQVVNVDGVNGVTSVNCSTIKWSTSGSNRGTEATEYYVTTSLSASNQSPIELFLTQSVDSVVRYGISVVAWDTVGNGGLSGDWVETFYRRTGVSSSNVTSTTVSASIKDPDTWGTMISGSWNLSASLSGSQIRLSPGTSNLVRWTVIVERVRRGDAA